ncbi:hypothetical protein GGI22_008071 [Coemansia erecta]|nr:hypothetical protein GGI22_008071 [Coemansia erecta]
MSAEPNEKAPNSSATSGAGNGGSEDVVTLNVDPNTLTVSDLYDKEKYDLETMDNKLVYQLLQTSPAGLTQAEATARVDKVSIRPYTPRLYSPPLALWRQMSSQFIMAPSSLPPFQYFVTRTQTP